MPSYSELSNISSYLAVGILFFVMIKSFIRVLKDPAYARQTFPKPNDKDWILIFLIFGLLGLSGIFDSLSQGDGITAFLFGAIVLVAVSVTYLAVALIPEKYHEDLYTIVVLGHIFRIFDRLKK